MHSPSPQTQNPAGGRGSAKQHVTGQVAAHGNAAAVQTSSRPRRCPWHAEVIERASRPGPWHATAIVHAGTGAWERARETHAAGRRAVTVCPPGTDPAAVCWPCVPNWIGDAADLPTEVALELARVLIDAGAELVQMVGERIKPSLVMRRAQHAH